MSAHLTHKCETEVQCSTGKLSVRAFLSRKCFHLERKIQTLLSSVSVSAFYKK